MRGATTLLACLLLGGCVSEPDVWHWPLVQCEEPPWGTPSDVDAIEAHYGIKVVSVHEEEDGFAYATVCGADSGRHVVVTPAPGDGEVLGANGWTHGPVPKDTGA